MAWHARVISNVSDPSMSNSIEVGFYDDVTGVPAEDGDYLARRTYSSEGIETVEEFVEQVIKDGQQDRAKYLRGEAVKSALPVGADIVIP